MNSLGTVREQDSERKCRDRCPVCGGELMFKRGCAECVDCGWTRC